MKGAKMLDREMCERLFNAGFRFRIDRTGVAKDPTEADLDEFIIQKAEERWPDLIDYLCLYVIYDFEEKLWELFIKAGPLSVLEACHVLDDDPFRGRALLGLKIAEVK
jgi:nitrate reductase assembly molybdenum cofactor insertion protein NarJ